MVLRANDCFSGTWAVPDPYNEDLLLQGSYASMLCYKKWCVQFVAELVELSSHRSIGGAAAALTENI